MKTLLKVISRGIINVPDIITVPIISLRSKDEVDKDKIAHCRLNCKVTFGIE
jgi:hypothetical protein